MTNLTNNVLVPGKKLVCSISYDHNGEVRLVDFSSSYGTNDMAPKALFIIEMDSVELEVNEENSDGSKSPVIGPSQAMKSLTRIEASPTSETISYQGGDYNYFLTFDRVVPSMTVKYVKNTENYQIIESEKTPCELK